MAFKEEMYKAGMWAREHSKFTAVVVALVFGLILGLMLR
jgi:hypothetical protein